MFIFEHHIHVREQKLLIIAYSETNNSFRTKLLNLLA